MGEVVGCKRENNNTRQNIKPIKIANQHYTNDSLLITMNFSAVVWPAISRFLTPIF